MHYGDLCREVERRLRRLGHATVAELAGDDLNRHCVRVILCRHRRLFRRVFTNRAQQTVWTLMEGVEYGAYGMVIGLAKRG